MVQNFEFQYFCGFTEKNNKKLGHEDFVDIFRGHHKIGLHLGVISMHFRTFLKAKIQTREYLFGFIKFQLFFVVLKIPEFFLGE